MAQQLVDEGRVFEEHIEEWRKTHRGKYALIKGSSVIGFFPELDKAFAAGTERFGLEPFFVKQIVPGDVVNVSFFGKRLLASS